MSYARRLDCIVIHCSATPNGRWTTVADVDRWHAAAGFRRNPPIRVARLHNPDLKHIGYHWLIYTNGGLATGRHPSEAGAHVRGLNACSIGLCLIGTDRFAPEQWTQLAAQVRHLGALFGIPMQRADESNGWRGVCGHRDTGANKLCPGFDVGDWLAADMQPHPDKVLTGTVHTDPVPTEAPTP